MKIAVVDDVKTDRDKLSAIVKVKFAEKGYPVTVLDPFDSGDALLTQFIAGRYDFIFLDIFMDGTNGIETAKKIRETDRSVKLIFITYSNDFASESYDVQANYYLLKPYGDKDITRMLENLELSDLEAKRILALPDGQSILLYTIIYTSFSGHYVTIHRNMGSPVRVRCTQSAFEQLLLSHYGFILCTKGIVVNLREVCELESNMFLMKNGEHVFISRRKYADVKKAYYDYLIQKTRMQGVC